VGTMVPPEPAAERYEQLIDALGNPAISGYASACLARIVSWSSPEDCAALVRLVKQARSEGEQS
jgi:hypothetical protein